MERPLTERRGILALEATTWEDQNLANTLTIAPLLAALRADCAPYVPVIHRTVLTSEEVARYVILWGDPSRLEPPLKADKGRFIPTVMIASVAQTGM